MDRPRRAKLVSVNGDNGRNVLDGGAGVDTWHEVEEGHACEVGDLQHNASTVGP
ncbi:MAG: hypothetical protein KY469_08825 [Actinobacteria bacterium]|nr:hypothetical protein [Actinomycetota bacterium]